MAGVFDSDLEDDCMMLKQAKLKKSIRYVIQGLPLAGIIVGSLLPLTTLGRQLLMLAALIWFQIYFIFEIFLNGK
jgi:hypothetical protein